MTRPRSFGLIRGAIAVALLAGATEAAAAPPATVELPIRFPADAGIANVKRYGAKGDGVTDDTAAIRAALRANNLASTLGTAFAPRTVHFPPGIYLVRDTLFAENPDWDGVVERERYLCAVRMIGAGEGRTVIRLAPSAPGFADPRAPKQVIRTGNSPANGALPNSGFANYIQHLTVEVGPGNPGAVGIRFDVANSGAIEHVTVRTTEPLQPALHGVDLVHVGGAGYIHDLTVQGFDWGLHFDRTNVNNYVLERIRLEGQRQGGILNEGKNLAILDLATLGSPVALRMTQADAAAVLVRADLDGQGSGPAIDLPGSGFLHLRDIEASGFGNLVSRAGTRLLPGMSSLAEWGTHGWMSGTGRHSFAAVPTGHVSMRLPIARAPEFHSNNFARWANVRSFGATPGDDRDDDAPAINRAIASGAETVYFPYGSYLVRSEVLVEGGVRKLDFLFSEIRADRARLRVGAVTAPATILEGVTGNLPVVHDGPADLVIRNARLAGPGDMVSVGPNASGRLFVENMGPHAAIRVSGGIQAWLRQLNRERAPLTNQGSTVWLLGDNVERMESAAAGTAIMNPILTTLGGRTEILGGAADANEVWHPAGLGAYIQSVDSRVSAIIAGVRDEDGGWDAMLSDRRSGVTVGEMQPIDIPSPAGGRTRIVMPLYVGPFPTVVSPAAI